MAEMEAVWPGNDGPFYGVPARDIDQLDRDLKTVLVEKASGTVHTKVVNGMPKGGVYIYTDIYKWFTETSGLGLMEQVNDDKCHATLHSRISNSSSSTRSSTKAAQQRSARCEGEPTGQPEHREPSLRPRQLTAIYAERAGAGPKAGSQYSMHDSQVLAAHHDLCG